MRASCMQSLSASEVTSQGDDVRTRAGLSPRDIDILVVNCSLFCPTPSLSAMIVNHFKMRGDVLAYNLGGMGCSAGVIAIGLAERLLRTEPGKYALVVSTENITQVRAGGALVLTVMPFVMVTLKDDMGLLKREVPPGGSCHYLWNCQSRGRPCMQPLRGAFEAHL